MQSDTFDYKQMKKQWYELLFENYAQKYDMENYTHGTIGECDFIEKEIRFDKSLKILDVGCGTGRHAIELTKRGYQVTGIDLSESQLLPAIWGETVTKKLNKKEYYGHDNFKLVE